MTATVTPLPRRSHDPRAIGATAWQHRFEQARQFTGGHGHAPGPGERAPDGYDIGEWLSRQHLSAANGSLRADRRTLLTDAGLLPDQPSTPPASPLTVETQRGWLDRLAAFRAEHGHTDVPVDYRTPGGHPLGAWLAAVQGAEMQARLDPQTATTLRFLGLPDRLQAAATATAERLGISLTEVVGCDTASPDRHLHSV